MGKDGSHIYQAFRMIFRVGKVAYGLDLPEDLSDIHSTFHDSRLQKCLMDDSIVVPLDQIHGNSA